MGREKQFFTKRRCKFCGEVKPIEEFRKNKRIACGYDGKCKSCHNATLRKRRLASHLAKFGLTVLAYGALLERQNGRCAICGQVDGGGSKYGLRRRLAVDHDHVTGIVRGLLCAKCNSALGLFEHDRTILARAMAYLLR